MSLELTPGGAPRRIEFSSAQLPPDVSDRRRRNLWRDAYAELYGPLEVSYADRPFAARIASAGIGTLGLTTSWSTVERFARTARCVATSGSDCWQLVLNASRRRMSARQLGRETVLAPGAMTLLCDSEPGSFRPGACNKWLFVTIPGWRLASRVRGTGDFVAKPLGGDGPATRHLRRYLALLSRPQGIDDDPALHAHVETTLLDLVALAFRRALDDRDVEQLRGLRAARLAMILAAIDGSFDSPACTVHAVAARVGLSPRYVQDLLHETGRSFTARVLERRLQKAHALLRDRHLGARKITDVAFDSGFGDLSYFDRAFRRRFCASPSDIRRGRG
jgi:AraC-like DNA-binding protein